MRWRREKPSTTHDRDRAGPPESESIHRLAVLPAVRTLLAVVLAVLVEQAAETGGAAARR